MVDTPTFQLTRGPVTITTKPNTDIDTLYYKQSKEDANTSMPYFWHPQNSYNLSTTNQDNNGKG